MEAKDSVVLLRIRTETDLKKLACFIRAGARSVRFEVAREMLDRAVSWMERFAEEHPGILEVAFVRPDGVTLRRFVAVGAATGAVVGGCLGGPGGAALGAIAGAVGGVAAAHLRITVDFGRDGEGAVLTLS